MQSSNLGRVVLVAGLVVLAVVGRILAESVPNFTPVAAVALFTGFCVRRRGLAILVPVLAMLVADRLYFGFYEPGIMLVVYAALAIPIVFGSFLRARLTPVRVAGASVAGSVVFFA